MIVRGPKLSGSIVGASEPTGWPALAEADLVLTVRVTTPRFDAIAWRIWIWVWTKSPKCRKL